MTALLKKPESKLVGLRRNRLKIGTFAAFLHAMCKAPFGTVTKVRFGVSNSGTAGYLFNDDLRVESRALTVLQRSTNLPA